MDYHFNNFVPVHLTHKHLHLTRTRHIRCCCCCCLHLPPPPPPPPPHFRLTHPFNRFQIYRFHWFALTDPRLHKKQQYMPPSWYLQDKWIFYLSLPLPVWCVPTACVHAFARPFLSPAQYRFGIALNKLIMNQRYHTASIPFCSKSIPIW